MNRKNEEAKNEIVATNSEVLLISFEMLTKILIIFYHIYARHVLYAFVMSHFLKMIQTISQ